MAKLNAQQLAFLESQGIPLDYVLDGAGMRRSAYVAKMEAEGKYFAFGVKPCAKGGHSIRNRNGDCIECNTAYIAYARRFWETSNVYIAGSLDAQLIKVGLSNDCDKRVRQLNGMAYGGVVDWRLLGNINTEEAGRIEFHIHERLKSKLKEVQYLKQGRLQSSSECFSCSYCEAKNYLLEMYEEPDLVQYEEHAWAQDYVFLLE